jgi:hypothetical protein
MVVVRVAEGPASLGPTRPGPVRRLVRLAALAVFAGVGVVVLVGQWPAVGPLLGRLSPVAVAGAAAAVLAGIFATFLAWRAILGGLGWPLPLTGGMRIFFLGQLGKYVPGSVWPAVAQMELGRDYKVPQRASGAAVVVFLLMVVGTGLAVTALTLPLLGPDAFDHYWWTLALLPAAAVGFFLALLHWGRWLP